MGKAKGNITNWKLYNSALKQRGSLTFWMDEKAIELWNNTERSGRRGRSHTYSDTAIATALMIKGVFKLPLRALEGFINSLFRLLKVDLKSPDYSCISKRAKTVEVNYRLPSQGQAAHLVIDATGLKVFGEGEWKVRKHGAEKRRVWRKLHMAVDAQSHQIVSAEVSMDWVHDSEVLPTLLRPLRRKVKAVSADGAYDTRQSYQEVQRKKAVALIPPRKNAGMWEAGHPRNVAVKALKQGELENWKRDNAYHLRSLSETAMYRFKQLLSDKLSLRCYNAQVGEIMAGVCALNKMSRLGMPVRQLAE
ncbi:IS5 family transposase [Agarivorans gilvus]|uniref:IS5 family transposase n=1 Tax=Agarivorans gilvus TaxID=680279 RepID=UPI0006EC0C8B|nr:IS5 family transposase [Agarivorans gilvus]